MVELEKPEGVIASLGGQTAINLAQPLRDHGVRIIGTDCDAIERAEEMVSFTAWEMEKVGYTLTESPEWTPVRSTSSMMPGTNTSVNLEDGVRAAAEIGYPVLVRPSFVLGGRAMEIVAGQGGDNPLWLLQLHHVHHVLHRQGLKVELVRAGVVGGHGLRVVVDDNGVVAALLDGLHGVDGGVVELPESSARTATPSSGPRTGRCLSRSSTS